MTNINLSVSFESLVTAKEDCEALKEDIKELQTQLIEQELSLKKKFVNKLKDCANLTTENQQLRKRITELESEVKL